MKSLHERLSEEHIKVLEQESLKYPVTTKRIVEALKETMYWTDLKYGIVCSLVSSFSLKSHCPIEIDSLFVN